MANPSPCPLSIQEGFLLVGLSVGFPGGADPGNVLISHKRSRGTYMSVHTHKCAPMNMTRVYIHVPTCGPMQETDSSLLLYIINKLTNHQESLKWINVFPKYVMA